MPAHIRDEEASDSSSDDSEPSENENEPEDKPEDAPEPGETSGVLGKPFKYRTGKQRAPYLEALNDWIDKRLVSPECREWSVDRNWIMSQKIVVLIARHPALTSVDALDTLKPLWVHRRRWGLQILELLGEVSKVQEAIQEEKARVAQAKKEAAQDKRRLADERRRKRADEKARQELEPAKRKQEDILGDTQPPQKKPRLAKNSTPEEVAARKEERRLEKNAKDRERNRRKAAEKKLAKQEETNQEVPLAGPSKTSRPQDTPEAGPSRLGACLTINPAAITFKAKEELLDDTELLLAIGRTATTTPALQMRHYHLAAPPTPQTPSYPIKFSFETTTPEDVQRQHQAPVSQPRMVCARQEHQPVSTPSAPVPRRRPIPKQPPPKDESN